MIRLLPGAPPVDEALVHLDPQRDRLIDAVRALAIIIVVLGHGFLAVVAWQGEVPRAGNLLASYPTAQLITWVFQVMPLFFFAGGYANATSWQHRGERSYAHWMWARARRLLRPLWGYFLVMIPVAALIGANASARISTPILIIATQLLWFLGIYVVITALTPVLVRLEARYEGVLIIGALVAIALIDAMRIRDIGGPIALLNFVFVWGLLTSLGIRYRHGRLSPRSGLLLALTAIAINIMLVLVLQWYPRSMVGMPGDPISNVAPPTFALAMHGVAVIGVVAALANPIRRGVHRVWRLTVLINLVMMTIYLWHLPALMLLFITERALGFERPSSIVKVIGPVPDHGFWVASIPHWIAFLVLVALLVRLLWPLEYLRIPRWDVEGSGAIRGAGLWSALGSGLIGVSLLMLSATGLNLMPMRTIRFLNLPINSLVAMAMLAVGAILIRAAARAR